MTKKPRGEVFRPDEIAVVHVMNRVVRRCFLMGVDQYTGKDYSHRRKWFEDELRRVAAFFGIDLLCFAILSNHFHLVLRSRPDVVATWDDTEVARRWLTLCPIRTNADGSACQPNDKEINTIILDPEEVKERRSRLSDISWWMRLVCQRIAQWANADEKEHGKFWQSRFKATRLLDDESLLACSAYVDLNIIRASLAKVLEESDYTSIQLRLQVLEASQPGFTGDAARAASADFLSPLEIDERNDPLGPHASIHGKRCSDKGFLSMPTAAYAELLNWTAQQSVEGKSSTPANTPEIFDRLKIKPEVWCQLVSQFGLLFSDVAGMPEKVQEHRSCLTQQTFYLPAQTRELLSPQPAESLSGA